MPDSPPFAHRVGLRSATARLRLDPGPPPRFDPAPLLTYRAPIDLDLIRPADGRLERVEFRIDTGAGVSQMSLARADELGVRIGDRRGEVETTTADGTGGQRVVVGAIRARFPGSDRLFFWDCLFFADRTRSAPSLLGLFGPFQQLRVTIDRGKLPGMPYGSMLFADAPPLAQPPAG